MNARAKPMAQRQYGWLRFFASSFFRPMKTSPEQLRPTIAAESAK